MSIDCIGKPEDLESELSDLEVTGIGITICDCCLCVSEEIVDKRNRAYNYKEPQIGRLLVLSH